MVKKAKKAKKASKARPFEDESRKQWRKYLEEYVATFTRLQPRRKAKQGFYKGPRKSNLTQVARTLGWSRTTLLRNLKGIKRELPQGIKDKIAARRAYASKKYAFQFIAKLDFVHKKTGKKRTQWVSSQFFRNLEDRDKAEEDLLNEVMGLYESEYVIKTGEVELRRRSWKRAGKAA